MQTTALLDHRLTRLMQWSRLTRAKQPMCLRKIDAYLGFPNETAGVINLSGVSLTGGSSEDPLFTISLTDLDTSQALAVYVSDVLGEWCIS